MPSTKKIFIFLAVFAAGFALAYLGINSVQRFSPIVQEQLESRATQEETDRPVALKSGSDLPPIRESLPESKFSNARAEDPSLRFVRDYGAVSSLPDPATIKNLPLAQLSVMMHSYLDNANVICQRKLRMGNIADGGWEVCDDYEWRPVVPCIVYSFGINYDFTFDDEVGKIYGCDVYSFDPSMKRQRTSYQRSGRVMFYAFGLGSHSGSPPIKTSSGWTLYSLSDFRSMLNHTQKIIDVLKMDIESAEWGAFRTMLQERQLSRYVRQLLVEFHVGAKAKASILIPGLQMLSDLEKVGFRRFYVHKNPACKVRALAFPVMRTQCYEVHFVNWKLRRQTQR